MTEPSDPSSDPADVIAWARTWVDPMSSVAPLPDIAPNVLIDLRELCGAVSAALVALGERRAIESREVGASTGELPQPLGHAPDETVGGLINQIEHARRALAEALLGASVEARSRFSASSDPVDADVAISMLRAAIDSTLPKSDDHACRLIDLARTLFARRIVDRTDEVSLNLSLEAATGALAALRVPSEAQSGTRNAAIADALGVLAEAHGERFSWLGDDGDLDTAIRFAMESLSIATDVDTARRAAADDRLALLLRLRHDHRGDDRDLDLAIFHAEASIAGTDASEPEYAIRLGNLGLRLATRFTISGVRGDLDRSIDLARAGLAIPGLSPHERRRLLGNLAIRLKTRHAQASNPEDLDAAIAMESEAMELAPPGSPQPLWLLNNLGVSISARYTRRGDPADLDRAIALAEEALALSPPGNADRPSRLSNLSIVLSTRYEHRGDAADLDRAIELSGQAIAETPVASPFLNIRQHNHGAHLAIRYDRQGAPADLDDAIELARAAIEGTPGDSPDQPSRRGNLALRYAARYAGRGRAEDLEASVREGEMALALTPVGAIERPIRLSNLASSLANSWRRASHLPVTHTLPSSPQSGGMTSTLTQAIALASEALDLLDPGDPERGAHLASLARFHQWHHDATSDLTDLVKAVAFAEASVHATPNGHPSRPSRLSLLASLLAADATNRETGLRATDLHRQAWDAITRTPGFAGFAVIAVGNGLADSLRRHFQTDSQDVVDELWRVLSVTLDALDGYLARLPLDADDDALYAVGTFGHLYAWLIEVAVRRVEDAAGRGASVEDLVRETFTAIERSKGRRLVSRLQAGALRPSASAQPFVDALERLKPELDRLETLLFGGREQPSQNLGSSGASVGANLPAMSLGWLSERSPLPQRSTSPIQPSQGGFPGVDDAKPGSVTANSAWAPPGSAGVSIGGQDAERSAADWGRMSDRLRALQTEFSELLRKIERSDPTYATARGYAPPQPLEAVAQALPPGAVLAMFAPMASRTAVVVVWVDGEGVTRFDLRTFGISEAQWVDLVHRTFGDGTRTEGSLQTLDRDLGAVLRAIGDRLIPVLAPLLSGATDAIPRHHLVIVPTGAMHRLPLHAVPWAPRGIARWDGVTRLIDRHPVTYATTADLLPLVTARSVSHSGVASLAPGIGLRPSDVEPHVTVALAVGLAREARLASSSSGGADDIALRLRADASREEILARSVVTGRRFGFVAAHGRAGRTGSSGLLLHRGDAFSDADLTAKDLHPTADQATSALGTGPGSWVTSSELLARLDLRGVDHLQMLACSTHADDPSPGDHLTSLLTALLICGARSVGGTLWAVDEVGAVLVGWKAGTALIRGETDKADALRRATRWLRTATSGEIGTVIAELGGALSEHLPAGDRAHTAIAVLAERFATVHAGHDEPPYADVVHWAPYVLHGAPIVGPHA